MLDIIILTGDNCPLSIEVSYLRYSHLLSRNNPAAEGQSNNMSIIFPTQNTLYDVFASSTPFPRPKSQAPIREHPLKRPIFSTWSAIDNIKDKSGGLSNEAAREFEKASSKAQLKAGAIELYSTKYYAACTFGGLLACVRSSCATQCKLSLTLHRALHIQP